MSGYFWVHGIEAECTSCLAAIDTYLGLPRAGTTKWADKQKAHGVNLWFYQDGSYPKMVEGEWISSPVRTALGGVTIVELDTPANLQAVIDEATTGKVVRIPFAKAVEFSFWPDEIV